MLRNALLTSVKTELKLNVSLLNPKSKHNSSNIRLTCCRRMGVELWGLSTLPSFLCCVCWWCEAYCQNIPVKRGQGWWCSKGSGPKRLKRTRETQTEVSPHRGTWTCPCGAAAVWWRWAPFSLCCPADQTAALGSARPSSPGSTHQSPPGSKRTYSSPHTGTPDVPAPLWNPGREIDFPFFNIHSGILLDILTYLYRVQMPPGSCYGQAGAGSSSMWDRLCFWGGTAAHPSCSGVLPLADTCSPSLVDLREKGGKRGLNYTVKQYIF